MAIGRILPELDEFVPPTAADLSPKDTGRDTAVQQSNIASFSCDGLQDAGEVEPQEEAQSDASTLATTGPHCCLMIEQR